MRRPGRFLGLGFLFTLPAAALTILAENRFDLGPDATFGLLMALSLIAAFVALRIVEGPILKPPPREEGDDR